MQGLSPRGVALLVGVPLGAITWILLVPSDKESAEPHVPAYPWIMLIVALAAGLAVGGSNAGLTGLAIGVTQLLLAPVTAPQGDGDGLWLLWIPSVAMLGVAMVVAALIGGWLRDRFS